MRVRVQLLTQALDVGVHRAVVARVLIAPDQGEQVVAGEHAAGGGGQREEQLDLLAGHVSGSMKKLIADGYVEKVGVSPVAYGLTDLGKNLEFDKQ